jgi:hypothetical protein
VISVPGSEGLHGIPPARDAPTLRAHPCCQSSLQVRQDRLEGRGVRRAIPDQVTCIQDRDNGMAAASPSMADAVIEAQHWEVS